MSYVGRHEGSLADLPSAVVFVVHNDACANLGLSEWKTFLAVHTCKFLRQWARDRVAGHPTYRITLPVLTAPLCGPATSHRWHSTMGRVVECGHDIRDNAKRLAAVVPRPPRTDGALRVVAQGGTSRIYQTLLRVCDAGLRLSLRRGERVLHYERRRTHRARHEVLAEMPARRLAHVRRGI